jgi:hypothetical protein
MALAAGKKVILATGRPIHEVLPYTQQLQLSLPLVINNGSEIWKTPAELHQRHELPAEQIRRIFDFIRPYRAEGLSFWAHTVSGKIDESNLPEDVDAVRWLQIAVKSADPDVLLDIRRELESWGQFEISNSHITNIECNARGISKASGLEEVCGMLGIPLSEAIAVGDSLNDIPMIRAAGLGVAMGNAQEPVKQAADYIAPTNSENGVAHVIERYMLS